MKRFLSVTLTGWMGLAAATPALADTTMSHTAMMMKQPAVVKTSGLKQRKEMTMPVIGAQTVITRVDKGVEWTLNPKKKTYTETPIALPYTPLDSSGSSSDGEEDGSHHDDTEADPTCTPEMKKLPSARTIAGLSASGYRMGCKENPEDGMNVWLAASTADTKKAAQDLKTFGAAHSKAMFANYPAKERADMQKGLSMMASIISELPQAMGAEKLPEGLWAATEMQSAEDGTQVFYELKSLSTAAIPADQFEIPAGYKKIAAGTAPMGLGDMDMKELMKELESFKK